MNEVEGSNTGVAPLEVLEREPKRSAPVVLMPRRLSVEQTRRTKKRASERGVDQRFQKKGDK
jgi:hypothetical protein